MLTILALLIGLIVLGALLQDAFEVMLLPRRVARRWRLTRGYFRLTWSLWRFFARNVPVGAQREQFLGIFGPLSMMLLFSIWAAGLIFAFALVQWALLTANGHAPAFGQQVYLSGVTFFTLGYGDVLPVGGWGKSLAVIEAGTGFGFIAVVIGYLPVLYQLFSRREAHVIQLDARAGSPPRAITLLRRHAESDGLAKIDDLLRAWEIWGSELLESHLSYPMLAYYRSQHDDQSWLAALAAIMDTCALILIGVADLSPLQARMTFAMARQVIVELVRSLDLPELHTPATPRFTSADYADMVAHFADAGLTWNGPEDGEEILAAVRATYEPQLAALADYLAIEIPGWSGGAETPDHWERGARGIIARRLVEGLAENSLKKVASGARDRRTFAGRLRARLKPRS